MAFLSLCVSLSCAHSLTLSSTLWKSLVWFLQSVHMDLYFRDDCYQGLKQVCIFEFSMAPRMDLTWDSKGMKKRCTEGHTEKLEIDGLTLRWRSCSTSEISVFLLYSWIERELIIYRWSSRWGYCTQVNKEPGCIVKTWIKEADLANHRMSDLCRGAVFRLWVS